MSGNDKGYRNIFYSNLAWASNVNGYRERDPLRPGNSQGKDSPGLASAGEATAKGSETAQSSTSTSGSSRRMDRGSLWDETICPGNPYFPRPRIPKWPTVIPGEVYDIDRFGRATEEEMQERFYQLTGRRVKGKETKSETSEANENSKGLDTMNTTSREQKKRDELLRIIMSHAIGTDPIARLALEESIKKSGMIENILKTVQRSEKQRDFDFQLWMWANGLSLRDGPKRNEQDQNESLSSSDEGETGKSPDEKKKSSVLTIESKDNAKAIGGEGSDKDCMKLGDDEKVDSTEGPTDKNLKADAKTTNLFHSDSNYSLKDESDSDDTDDSFSSSRSSQVSGESDTENCMASCEDSEDLDSDLKEDGGSESESDDSAEETENKSIAKDSDCNETKPILRE